LIFTYQVQQTIQLLSSKGFLKMIKPFELGFLLGFAGAIVVCIIVKFTGDSNINTVIQALIFGLECFVLVKLVQFFSR
jgi:hypothetical protein